MQYGIVEEQEDISRRFDRIRQLEGLWDRLNIGQEGEVRLIKDKINLLLSLGHEYRAAGEFEKGEIAIQKAIALNNKVDTDIEAILYLELGGIYLESKKYKQSLNFLNQALKITEKSSDSMAGQVYFEIGNVYAHQGIIKEALNNYANAIKYYDELKDENGLGNLYHQIGKIHSLSDGNNQAFRNFQFAIEKYKNAGNRRQLVSVYEELADLSIKQSKFGQAFINYQEALNWCKKLVVEDNILTGNIYYHMGDACEGLHEFEKALFYYDESAKCFLKDEFYDLLFMVKQSIKRVEQEIKEHKKGKQ